HVEDGSPPSLYLLLKPRSGNEIPIFPSGTTFSQKIPLGSYRVAVGGLEHRYQIQSVTYGDVDLRKEPLRITADNADMRELSVRLKDVGRVGEIDVQSADQ